jgi:hypothetical protein
LEFETISSRALFRPKTFFSRKLIRSVHSARCLEYLKRVNPIVEVLQVGTYFRFFSRLRSLYTHAVSSLEHLQHDFCTITFCPQHAASITSMRYARYSVTTSARRRSIVILWRHYRAVRDCGRQQSWLVHRSAAMHTSCVAYDVSGNGHRHHSITYQPFAPSTYVEKWFSLGQTALLARFRCVVHLT